MNCLLTVAFSSKAECPPAEMPCGLSPTHATIPSSGKLPHAPGRETCSPSGTGCPQHLDPRHHESVAPPGVQILSPTLAVSAPVVVSFFIYNMAGWGGHTGQCLASAWSPRTSPGHGDTPGAHHAGSTADPAQLAGEVDQLHFLGEATEAAGGSAFCGPAAPAVFFSLLLL